MCMFAEYYLQSWSDHLCFHCWVENVLEGGERKTISHRSRVDELLI